MRPVAGRPIILNPQTVKENTATKTLRDLRVAEVNKLDWVIVDCKVTAFPRTGEPEHSTGIPLAVVGSFLIGAKVTASALETRVNRGGAFQSI